MSVIEAKQRCITIINHFPEEQLTNLAASLETMLKMIDDAMDEAYCLELYQNSFGDENDEPQDLHEFAKSLGLDVK